MDDTHIMLDNMREVPEPFHLKLSLILYIILIVYDLESNYSSIMLFCVVVLISTEYHKRICLLSVTNNVISHIVKKTKVHKLIKKPTNGSLVIT